MSYKADAAMCQSPLDKNVLSDMVELHADGAMLWPKGLSPMVAEQMLSLFDANKAGVGTMKAEDILRSLEAFLTCPLSKTRYVDPVFCTGDEQTYERATIESLIRLGPDGITGRTSPISEPFTGPVKLIPNHFVRLLVAASQRLQAIVDMAGDSRDSCYSEQGGAFTCPLTLDTLSEPMITPSGHTYSGAAIRKCVDQCGFSPQTKRLLRSDQLVPNRALMEAMKESQRKDDVIERLKSIAKMFASRAAPSTPKAAPSTPKRRRLREHHTV